MNGADNGEAVSNGQAAQLPPWADVEPKAVVVQLSNQLAGLMQQIAMRDAYIAQLHQALQQVTGSQPVEATVDAG